VCIAFAADAIELQHEGERRVVLFGTLLVGERKTRVDEAQVEARALGFRDGVGVNRHGGNVCPRRGVGKGKIPRGPDGVWPADFR
jgi:hypothetical protein